MRVIGRKLRWKSQVSDRANPPAALAVSRDNIAEVPAKVALEVRQIGVVARRLGVAESRADVVECAFKSHHRARGNRRADLGRTEGMAIDPTANDLPLASARRGAARPRARPRVIPALYPRGILPCFRFHLRFEINGLAGRFRVAATFPPSMKSITWEMSPHRLRDVSVACSLRTRISRQVRAFGDRSRQVLSLFEYVGSCSMLQVEPVCDRYRNLRRPAMHARREPNPQRSVAGNRCRKVHPADAANAALFARAVRFDIALFLGTGGYARAGAPTLEKARVEARRLAAENASPFGKRQPLIYGITVDGASAFAEAVRSEPDSIE